MRKTPFVAALQRCIESGERGIKGECAKATGISAGYFSELFHGKKEGKEEIRRAIAAFFDFQYEEFLSLGQKILRGDDSSYAQASYQRKDDDGDLFSGFSAVRMAESRLSAGGGNFVLKDGSSGIYYFRTDWLSSVCSPGQAVLFQVDGISMYPTINHRDTVLIDMSRCEFENDRIFAIGVGDRVLLKRLRLNISGKLEIVSDNEDKQRFPTEIIDVEEVRILGHAVWHAGMI